MPEFSTYCFVASIVIERVLAQNPDSPPEELREVLRRSYPFPDQDNAGRRAWRVELVRRMRIRIGPARALATGATTTDSKLA